MAEGQKIVLPLRQYLRLRGQDYVVRLCVRQSLHGREYLRFVEDANGGTLPYSRPDLLVYAGGCCVNPAPAGTGLVAQGNARESLQRYKEDLERFHRGEEGLESDLEEQRQKLTSGCKGCGRKRSLWEQEIQAAEREARRKAIAGGGVKVESKHVPRLDPGK